MGYSVGFLLSFLSAGPVIKYKTLSSRLRTRRFFQRYLCQEANGQTKDSKTTKQIPLPRKFYIRPDKYGDMFFSSLASLPRLGTGAFVVGYRADRSSQGISEYSEKLPNIRPQKPLELYEFEACPFCRKVREALSMLDLDAFIYPCPKGGQRFRPRVVELGGKQMFPYLVDPNTGFSTYESDDIVEYLFKTYGDGRVPIALALGFMTNLTSSLSSAFRLDKGVRYRYSIVPEKPLELWSYEPSPFCRLVREVLCELELPYLLHNVARGSVKRKELKRLTGTFQVPYLVDPNTQTSMFESANIVEYLMDTYILRTRVPSATKTTSTR